MTDPSRSGPDPVATALSLARNALGAAPAGLLTDLDGTLAPIVDDPDGSRPLPEAVAALTTLTARLAVVAVISGRAPDDARRRLRTDRLLVIGNHGQERLEPGAERAALSPALAQAAEAIHAVLARVPREEGVWVDDKGPSATVHYRSAPDPQAAAERIAAALGDVTAAGLIPAAGAHVVGAACGRRRRQGHGGGAADLAPRAPRPGGAGRRRHRPGHVPRRRARHAPAAS